MESDRGENLNSEVEDPLPDYHEAKGSHSDAGAIEGRGGREDNTGIINGNRASQFDNNGPSKNTLSTQIRIFLL